MNDESTLAQFDYGNLPPEIAFEMRGSAERIKLRMRRTGDDIIAIGKELIAAKARLGHGHYIDWIKGEFGMSQPTASRFTTIAEAFGDKSFNLNDLNPSVLYALASAPEEIQEKVIEQAQDGNRPTVKEVEAMKREYEAIIETKEALLQAEIRKVSQKQAEVDELTLDMERAEERFDQMMGRMREIQDELDWLQVQQEPEVMFKPVPTLPPGYTSEEEAIKNLLAQKALLSQEMEDMTAKAEAIRKRLKAAEENERRKTAEAIAKRMQKISTEWFQLVSQIRPLLEQGALNSKKQNSVITAIRYVYDANELLAGTSCFPAIEAGQEQPAIDVTAS